MPMQWRLRRPAIKGRRQQRPSYVSILNLPSGHILFILPSVWYVCSNKTEHAVHSYAWWRKNFWNCTLSFWWVGWTAPIMPAGWARQAVQVRWQLERPMYDFKNTFSPDFVNIQIPETCFAYTISEQKWCVSSVNDAEHYFWQCWALLSDSEQLKDL